MIADLCRRLALAKQSPYMRYLVSMRPEISDELQEECLQAYTFDKLPARAQELITKSERSFEILEQEYKEVSTNFLGIEKLQEIFFKVENG